MKRIIHQLKYEVLEAIYNMISNFNFKIIDQFLGYNSERDKTNIDSRYLVRGSKNVYKKETGTISVRPGLKRRGSADTTSEGVKSSYEWEASNGVTKPLRVANSKFQVESDIVTSGTYVWYDLMSSLTNTRFVFDTWWDNTLKKDVLLYVIGDDNLYRWEGGIAKLSSTTSNTIVLDRTVASSGMSTASGTVIINGTDYAYTGSSASTLTGVTPDPTGEAADSVIVSKPITNANSPAADYENDFLKVINNQVFIGSYSSRLVYISEDDDYLDYTVPATRAPGDPEQIFLDNLARGIGVINGEAHISAGYSDWYKVRFNQITVSTTLTEQTIVDKLELSGQEAAMGHEYISNIGGNIVYLSRGNELKLLGTFTNQQQTKPATLSLPIKGELANETFTPVAGTTSDGEVRAIGGRVYLTSVSGGTTYIHETRESLDESGQVVAERFWQPPQIWGISRVSLISGTEFGHSIANPQIYQLWDTEQWKDDSPADEDLHYDSIMRMAYINAENRASLLSLDMIYAEGYMSQGTPLKARFYADYQGSTSLQELELNKVSILQKLAKFFTGFSSPGVGDSSLGDNPLGEGLTEDELSQEQLPKFRRIKDITAVDCFEYSLEFYTDEVNSRWEILALGTNAVKNIRQATFIK